MNIKTQIPEHNIHKAIAFNVNLKDHGFQTDIKCFQAPEYFMYFRSHLYKRTIYIDLISF